MSRSERSTRPSYGPPAKGVTPYFWRARQASSSCLQMLHRGLPPCPYRWQGCWHFVHGPTCDGAHSGAGGFGRSVEAGAGVLMPPVYGPGRGNDPPQSRNTGGHRPLSDRSLPMPDPAEPTFRSSMTVELVKHTASDADVLFAARVSTVGEQSLDEIGKDPERSKGLINYLMRDRHGSPFEHNSMTFFVSAPIF